jgi:protein-disulfide isomerase
MNVKAMKENPNEQEKVNQTNRDARELKTLYKTLQIIAGTVILAGLMISGSILYVSKQSFAIDGNRNAGGVPVAAKDNPNVPAQDIILAPVTEKDWVRGDRGAKVTIVEFSDTECPFCKRIHPTFGKIVKDYKGKVNWVYRHAPLAQLHSKAAKESEALECSGDQKGNDGFWKYTDALYEKTPSNNGLDVAELPKIAQSVGLDVSKFNDCLASGKYAAKVAESLKQAEAAGMQGTPYSIIVSSDKKIPLSGAVPESAIKAVIDPLLQ